MNQQERAPIEAERGAEDPQKLRCVAVEREAAAMSRAFAILVPLNHGARMRALRWLNEALEDMEMPF